MKAEELRGLRRRMRLTLIEMAARLGISRSTLIDYERGFSRGHPDRSAAIPPTVELAVKYLVEHPEEIPPKL